MSLEKVHIIIKDGPTTVSHELVLNLKDNLSNIRKELENEGVIDDTLSFSKIIPKNDDDEIDKLAEIVQEADGSLKEILEKVDGRNNLYLMKNKNLNILYKKRKLDYGCTMSFDGIKRANERAFTIKSSKFSEFDGENPFTRKLEFNSKEDWMMKKNLFFSNYIDVRNFAEIGLSESSQNKNFGNEIISTYQCTEYRKKTLKLSRENLEPTQEFISAVKDAMKSMDCLEKFREITKDYGQFIPTETILGGRVYFENIKKTSGGSQSSITEPLNNNPDNDMESLGGKRIDVDSFNEQAWIKSLNDYLNWECIEFKNPISIFQFLPDDLRKETFKSIGKRILYTTIEDYDYHVHGPQKQNVYELPSHISNLFQNEEADCDIFAAVSSTEDSENVFFTCQILRPSSEKPRVMIYCVQKNHQARSYKLKIGLMIIGYDTKFDLIHSDVKVKLKKNPCDSQDECFNSMALELEHDLIIRNIPFFGIPVLNGLNNSLIIGHNFHKDNKDNGLRVNTFSYSLEKKCYVDLPKFTYYTFIILNSNAYKSFPFKFNMSGKPFIDFEETCSSNLSKFKSIVRRHFRKRSQFNSLNPKYVSLYLPKNSYTPIFLNQKSKRIDVEYVECNCNNTCKICTDFTLRISKNDRSKCIFFDPNTRVIRYVSLFKKLD